MKKTSSSHEMKRKTSSSNFTVSMTMNTCLLTWTPSNIRKCLLTWTVSQFLWVKMWQYLEMIATTFNKLEHNISFSKCNDNSQYSKWKTHGTGECIWYHHAHKYTHANPFLINNFAFGSKINFFQLICDYTLQFQYMRARCKRCEMRTKLLQPKTHRSETNERWCNTSKNITYKW